MRAWTSRDINLMSRYYANSSNRAVAAVLGRSVDSVEHKARRSGLRKARNYNRSHNIVISNSNRKRTIKTYSM